MSRSLPPTPSLEHLKKEAKDLLRRQRRKDPAALPPLHLLPRFRDLPEDEVLGADVSLAEAQQAVAMRYGYKNWQVLRTLVVQVMTPDPSWPAAKYYRDYRWCNGAPCPEGPMAEPQTGRGYFRFISVAGGVRVEQYDAQGAFVRICHDPADRVDGARKLRWQGADGRLGAGHLDATGKTIFFEKYDILAEGDPPVVRAEIYNADGRLIEIHTPRRTSATSEDIQVTDALGKLKVVLHHRELDKGEPVDIEEEWSS